MARGKEAFTWICMPHFCAARRGNMKKWPKRPLSQEKTFAKANGEVAMTRVKW